MIANKNKKVKKLKAYLYNLAFELVFCGVLFLLIFGLCVLSEKLPDLQISGFVLGLLACGSVLGLVKLYYCAQDFVAGYFDKKQTRENGEENEL